MARVISFTVAAFLIAAAACASDGSDGPPGDAAGAYPVTVGSVTIAQRPERIVSLSPTATEILFAVGAGDQVVAVDDQSNYPDDAPTTDLSGFEPNIEAIVGYEPDLVVFANDLGDLAAGLEAADVPALLQPAAATLDDTYAQITDLGRATGHVEEAAEVVEEMQAEVAAIVDAAPQDGRTYYHELDQTYFTVTSDTFIGQVYSLFGLRNIADEAGEEGNQYPQLSAEAIVDTDPDLIFLADTKCCDQSAETVAARPGWGGLTAVRTGGVVALDDDIASRWGPRIVDLLRDVAAAIEALDEAA